MANELVINENWQIPEFGITLDPRSSYIPTMPETVDTNVSVEGTDGEINLSTTYGPRNFELLCYSNDGLEDKQKVYFEDKVARFLHKFKNTPFLLVLKPRDRSYEVKYSGALETNEYAGFVRMTIPLKSVKSFGIRNTKSVIIGDGEKDSYTVEPVGFLCTIKGPATNPKISFNGTEMSYEKSLLSSEYLTINTKIFTVTKTDTDYINNCNKLDFKESEWILNKRYKPADKDTVVTEPSYDETGWITTPMYDIPTYLSISYYNNYYFWFFDENDTLLNYYTSDWKQENYIKENLLIPTGTKKFAISFFINSAITDEEKIALFEENLYRTQLFYMIEIPKSEINETNELPNYNREFPKVVEGKNTVEIVSGIDNKENVTIEWNDLAF